MVRIWTEIFLPALEFALGMVRTASKELMAVKGLK